MQALAELHTASQPPDTDDHEADGSPSASSDSLDDILAQQAAHLLQQMQAGLQQARISSRAGQRTDMQPQTVHMPLQVLDAQVLSLHRII